MIRLIDYENDDMKDLSGWGGEVCGRVIRHLFAEPWKNALSRSVIMLESGAWFTS